MAKIKVKLNIDEETGRKYHPTQYAYFCRGCGYEHVFELKSTGGHHEFNGDLNNPTVSPSLVQGWVGSKRCHSFIRDGKIQYLDDCEHELRGQTVELSEI